MRYVQLYTFSKLETTLSKLSEFMTFCPFYTVPLILFKGERPSKLMIGLKMYHLKDFLPKLVLH